MKTKKEFISPELIFDCINIKDIITLSVSSAKDIEDMRDGDQDYATW